MLLQVLQGSFYDKVTLYLVMASAPGFAYQPSF